MARGRDEPPKLPAVGELDVVDPRLEAVTRMQRLAQDQGPCREAHGNPMLEANVSVIVEVDGDPGFRELSRVATGAYESTRERLGRAAREALATPGRTAEHDRRDGRVGRLHAAEETIGHGQRDRTPDANVRSAL